MGMFHLFGKLGFSQRIRRGTPEIGAMWRSAVVLGEHNIDCRRESYLMRRDSELPRNGARE
jgi:hypothetical protein